MYDMYMLYLRIYMYDYITFDFFILLSVFAILQWLRRVFPSIKLIHADNFVSVSFIRDFRVVIADMYRSDSLAVKTFSSADVSISLMMSTSSYFVLSLSPFCSLPLRDETNASRFRKAPMRVCTNKYFISLKTYI